MAKNPFEFGDSSSQKLGSHDELNIYNNIDEENTACIYDMTGKGVSIGSLNRGVNVIELDWLNVRSGLYVIKVMNALGKTLAAEKFVMQ